jgi:hypothetical protein
MTCTKSSQSAVFTSCYLVTAPNAVNSPASVYHASCPQWLVHISTASSYIASEQTSQKKQPPTALLVLHMHIRCQRDVFTSHCLPTATSSGSAICCHMFTVLLLSNGRLCLFQYSSFQLSCHNIIKIH